MTKDWQKGFGLGPERTEPSSKLRTIEEKNNDCLGGLVTKREGGGEVQCGLQREKIDVASFVFLCLYFTNLHVPLFTLIRELNFKNLLIFLNIWHEKVISLFHCCSDIMTKLSSHWRTNSAVSIQ